MNDRERKRRWVLAGFAIAGLLLRVLLIVFPRSLDDDSAVYAELGWNLLHHGTYGFMDDGAVSPSLIRLPGYPLILGLFGVDTDLHRLWLVETVQAAIDLLGCWLLARFLWVWSGERAGDIALGLGSLCCFTAAYAATGLTESLSVFAVALGIWAFGRTMLVKTPGWREMLPVAGAGALAMLLRPDGVLLLAALLFAVIWYGRSIWGWARSLRTGLIVAVLSCLPLVPWTVRNWESFHVFQPLAPRHVNDPGEPVNLGFYRWLRTWSTEFTDTGNVFWQVGLKPIEMSDLPAWGYDSTDQKARTAKLIAVYNVKHDVTPELDAQFAALAQERISAHPLQYYVLVPALRAADMWLRPRTETYHLDAAWWRWSEHPWESAAALALGLLNLAYVVLALCGLRLRYVPFARWMLLYLVARSLMLATLENPEPRYTVEAYPILIVCAACWLGGRFGGRWLAGNVVNAGKSDLAELFAESFPVVERGDLQ